MAPLPRRPPRGAEPTLRPPLAVLAASTGDWARREHLVPPRAAARAMPDLEPEPEPDPQQLLLHRELATMTLGALTRRAIESEVPAAEIGQAIDADDPKATLRDLVLGRATPERLLLPGSSAQRETTIKPRAGETRNEAIMRTMDESVPGPSTATLRSVEGSVHEYDGACKFNKLTTAVDRCVYKQPWDRLLCTYLWRIHSDLPDDLHAKLRMPCGRATTPKPGCKIVEYDFDLDMPGAIRFAAGVSSYKWYGDPTAHACMPNDGCTRMHTPLQPALYSIAGRSQDAVCRGRSLRLASSSCLMDDCAVVCLSLCPSIWLCGWLRGCMIVYIYVCTGSSVWR